MEKEKASFIGNQRWTRIVLLLVLLYIINFIDRNNISYAVIGGMNQALRIGTATAGLAGGLFYIGYIVLQIPSGIWAERYNNKLFIATLTFLWGVIATITGFVQNSAELLALRFLLGLVDGGVFTAILVLISHWFPERERATANGLFFINLPLSFIVAGPLSGFILHATNWRMLFVYEGIPAIVVAFLFYFLASSRPEDAKWLSEPEKQYILSNQVNPSEKQKKGYKDALLHPQVLVMSGIYFFWLIGVVGFFMWLPAIITDMSHQGIMNVGLISTLPYVAALIGLIVLGRWSDQSQKRRPFIGVSLLLFGFFLLLSAINSHNYIVSLIFIVLSGFFIFSSHAPFWAMPVEMFPRELSGAAMGMISLIGNIGSFVGPYLVGIVKQTTGSFTMGLISMVISLLIAAALTLALRTYKVENSQRATYNL